MMEKIKINEIVKKDKKASGSQLVIVKYEVQGIGLVGIKEATMNAKWQSQEVWYLENEVGIGGSVLVEINVNGNYTNIDKVDMKSAEKGNVSVANPQEVHNGSSLMSQKEIGMCAGGMLKCMYYNRSPENEQEVLDMYHFFVKSLEDNG